MARNWQRVFEDWLVGDEPAVSGEWRAYCPIHEDPSTSTSPSASFNFAKGVWNHVGHEDCNSTIQKLYDRLLADNKLDPDVVQSMQPRRKKRQGRPSVETEPLPTLEQVKEWHETLVANPSLLRVMTEERGLTKRTLKKFLVGHHRGRYTIPVFDADGVLVNVRRYKPHATEARTKMVNITGHGSARLFLPQVAATHDEVVITEGEMDALASQDKGLDMVMSHTGGSGTWKLEWCRAFAGKHVFLCYDLDDSGTAGANRAAEALRATAEAIYIMRLPMAVEGGDATDFFVKQSRTKEDFLAAMEAARERPFFVRGVGDILPEPKRVSLEDSQDAGFGDHPLEIFGTIAGKMTPAYVAPKRIEYRCDMGWRQETCQVCSMNARDGVHTETLQPHDSNLVRIVGYGDNVYRQVLAEIADVPARCPRVQMVETESYSVEELIVGPSVAHRTEEVQRPVVRRVLNVGHHATPINSTARIVAKQVPDPRDRRGVLLAFDLEPVETDLDKFEVTPEIVERLKVFRPEQGQSPLSKMEDIAEDLAHNVTRIYGRPELHMAYDVVWHSVMNFSFNGAVLGKGWLELCVIGDTRTGKSEAARKLSRHYRAGVVQSCEGASFAGLVGGVQQVGGGGWIVTWGLIPLNDRRLVVLDEFGGIADKGIIEQMSDIRSSGHATITKIQTDETSARTRLIWIANPLDGKTLSEMHQPGISALQTLVKNPEDIARFDLAMACASGDVEPGIINMPDDYREEHFNVPHVYTEELCTLLVQWAWSRKPEHVLFSDGVERAIVQRAVDLGARYVPEPPLVQVENVRIKLARLAVAVAARTFSTDRSGKRIVVRMQHVESAIALLDRLYGMPSFSYMSASRRILNTRKAAKEQYEAARKYLRVERDGVTQALMSVRNNTGFKIQDFGIFGGLDNADAQVAVKELTKMGMIRSMSHGKLKIEPPLMALLHQIEEEEERRDG